MIKNAEKFSALNHFFSVYKLKIIKILAIIINNIYNINMI